MKFKCAHCGKTTDKPTGAVNRARNNGLRLFCGRECSGLGRSKNKTAAQKKEEKRLYDMQYRASNRAMLKVKRHEYFKRTYDPDQARIERKKRMPRHIEYCRRPEYKAWKREYDRKHRADEYGPFADVYLLSLDLNREIKNRSTRYEIDYENGKICKAQKRRRASSQEPERSRKRARERRPGDPAAHG